MKEYIKPKLDFVTITTEEKYAAGSINCFQALESSKTCKVVLFDCW